MEIKDRADEERVATSHLDKLVVVQTTDWTIIPLENLIARRSGLMTEVSSAEEARLMMEVMEKGVDGVVLNTASLKEVRDAVALVKSLSPKLDLVPVEVKTVRRLGMGDRACVDTCSTMGPGQGMLVGNSGQAMFLVHSESLETPYVAPRPFRVNAGAVHAYTLLPDRGTKYLGELKAGDEVLIVRHDGQTSVAYVGRNKVERRPLMLVEAEVEGRSISIILQNGETIRLTDPDGKAVSLATLKAGDEVLAYLESGGRHFGRQVEETITEK
jgi:3-dehydroquinate synthase II